MGGAQRASSENAVYDLICKVVKDLYRNCTYENKSFSYYYSNLDNPNVQNLDKYLSVVELMDVSNIFTFYDFTSIYFRLVLFQL